MKVLVAGATGALGRPLVRQLSARGHEVFGMTRGPSKAELVRSLGAKPLVADALDPEGVARAVAESEPEVIVHQANRALGVGRRLPRGAGLSEPLSELRPVAFSVAYRMLGSVSEAEDVVQETLLRVHALLEDGERIESPRAYAATVATRLAIDELRSARARREVYAGEWLPEPIVTSPVDDPAFHAELADSLSLAFLVLLESLSPEQRAAFLLREVFDYSYWEIAEIVGKSEDNARQLAARARRHVEERRPRFEASREQRDALADRFFAAAQEGELDALEALLAEDVELHGDGGGKVPALARMLSGRDRVKRTIANWGRQRRSLPGVTMRRADVNGQPGALVLDSEGRVFGVFALDIRDGQVQSIRSVVNPDKLRHLGDVGDMRAILEARDR